MERKRKAGAALRISIALSMLAAISIICGKYLAINAGEFMRFSFENLPIIFAGIAFGPLAAAAVGAVADLVGCLLVGYAINPLVTLGAVSVGLISGTVWHLLTKTELHPAVRLTLTLFAAHAVGSVVIKGIGLSAFYSIPLGVLMLWRLLNYLVVGIAEGILLFFLIKSGMVTEAVRKIKRGE